WKPPAHSPEENMVRQKCSGIRRSYLAIREIKYDMSAYSTREELMAHYRPYCNDSLDIAES
ncbi:hypothetical protein, partial [Klebsiella pneumoniae]|uniref:hypothetical protein n=1 Tax=Klebsiella pneumoniae TaxID=573 RepID=UPI001C62A2F3